MSLASDTTKTTTTTTARETHTSEKVYDVVMLLAPGFEEIEAVTVIDLLRRAGIEVLSVGVGGGQIRGGHGINIDADMILKDRIPACRYLVLPGGLGGTNVLAHNKVVVETIKARHAQKKGLAAICAAPSHVLGAFGVLEGYNYTGYPMGDEISKFCKADAVVSDGHLVTSKSVATAIPFALELIAKLTSLERAREIASGILFDA